VKFAVCWTLPPPLPANTSWACCATLTNFPLIFSETLEPTVRIFRLLIWLLLTPVTLVI
jgi:hypothetical protein